MYVWKPCTVHCIPATTHYPSTVDYISSTHVNNKLIRSPAQHDQTLATVTAYTTTERYGTAGITSVSYWRAAESKVAKGIGQTGKSPDSTWNYATTAVLHIPSTSSFIDCPLNRRKIPRVASCTSADSCTLRSNLDKS
jgi:hypothetical protein